MKFKEIVEKVDSIVEASGTGMIQHVAQLHQKGEDLEALTQEDMHNALDKKLGETLKLYSTKEKTQLLKYCICVFASQYANGIVEGEVEEVIETEG